MKAAPSADNVEALSDEQLRALTGSSRASAAAWELEKREMARARSRPAAEPEMPRHIAAQVDQLAARAERQRAQAIAVQDVHDAADFRRDAQARADTGVRIPEHLQRRTWEQSAARGFAAAGRQEEFHGFEDPDTLEAEIRRDGGHLVSSNDPRRSR